MKWVIGIKSSHQKYQNRWRFSDDNNHANTYDNNVNALINGKK